MNNVVCMKWGTKYGPDYVNRLHSMVERNLTIPHRFVCFTDDTKGLDPAIETLPLPLLDPPFPKGVPNRGWNKLPILSERLGDLHGKVLFLDVDVVVTGNMDDFFHIDGEFRIIHDWLRPKRITGNTSVFRFEAGRHADILELFNQRRDEAMTGCRNEQAYITNKVHEKGILQYWPESWCRSFKYHCSFAPPLGWFRTPAPPKDAKILIFHGNPNPHEAVRGYRKGWKRTPPTPWIEQYWR